MTTDGVHDGQTLLCRYELLSNDTSEKQDYALACRQAGLTDHEFGLHCFLVTAGLRLTTSLRMRALRAFSAEAQSNPCRHLQAKRGRAGGLDFAFDR